MKASGKINNDQLAREQYGEEKVYLAGFGSYAGRVIAGEAWGAPMQQMEVAPAREGSTEHALHHQSREAHYLLLNDEAANDLYFQRMPHRAIGVVYDPRQKK